MSVSACTGAASSKDSALSFVSLAISPPPSHLFIPFALNPTFNWLTFSFFHLDKCVKDKKTGEPWLKRQEVCLWAGAGNGGQCVRNKLRDGAKFYPFVSSSKVVCVQPTEVYGEKWRDYS
jgi:hypothetical protein